ncbi:MAG: pseudouridine-5'-phosphate glycosidase [Chloroflexota bacterium]
MTKLHFHSDVQEAIENKQPVVALESTVITHGLPYPQNVETAVSMETAVKSGGATPATIAILSGEIHIGLTREQIEYLGKQPQENVHKCSRRNIPIAIGKKEHGATTVAGTMILAHQAGISIFATGGIGGVHRGHPFDVSADLQELSRTPVAVICSGAKSILDLPATREVLETNGVPILGYQTDMLPSFFSRSSGLSIDIRIEDAKEAANIIQSHQALSLQNGLLITVPVPEAEACDPVMIEQAIQKATKEAEAAGVHGPESTPWLLSRIVDLTNGQSMRANRALLQNNGFVAGQIAQSLTKLT